MTLVCPSATAGYHREIKMGLFTPVFNAHPARYRSRATGRYVSEDFARRHPDEAYSVNPRISAPLLVGIASGFLVIAAGAGTYLRSRR